MKKTLAILGLMAVATLSYAQGIVSINQGSTVYANSTNTGISAFVGGSGSLVATGLTATASSGFYYALLDQAYTGTLTDNGTLAISNGWTLAMMGTNATLAKGGVNGPGGAAGSPAAGWGAPTGASYNTGTEDYFILVGWSANLTPVAGITTPAQLWAAIQSQIQSGTYLVSGYLGESALGYGYSGGGPNLLPATSIYGVTAGMPGGLTGGFYLSSVAPTVPIPEPTVFALLGLGAAGLLIFRRRK